MLGIHGIFGLTKVCYQRLGKYQYLTLIIQHISNRILLKSTLLSTPPNLKKPKLQQKIRQPHQGHPPTKFFSTSLPTPELSTPPQ